jgi:hypothetical protein
MGITASKLRENVYRILDQVLESGAAVEVERRGRRLRIVPVEPTRRLGRLRSRPEYLKAEPEALVHLDWSREWRP